MKFMKKHSTAILIAIAIALAVILVVGMILLHGGKKEPQFGTYTEPENTTTGIETTGPAVDPTTEPQITQPEDTVPLTTETLPDKPFETTDGNGPTEPSVSEPVVTTPAPTTPKATEPVKTTPKATEPQPTTPKATEPQPTTPKATEPQPTTPKATEPEKTDPIDEFGGVTPDNISVANTAGWSTDDFDWFYEMYKRSMTTAQKRAYWEAYYDGYDCGVEGHDCKCANDHIEFTRPCQYCGLTLECKGRICKDQYGFTYCDDSKCYSYDEKLNPSKYCQTCGKPKYGDPTQTCGQKIMDGNCSICGVYLKAHTCHTCKQEDIDAYNKGN